MAEKQVTATKRYTLKRAGIKKINTTKKTIGLRHVISNDQK